MLVITQRYKILKSENQQWSINLFIALYITPRRDAMW